LSSACKKFVQKTKQKFDEREDIYTKTLNNHIPLGFRYLN